MGYRRSTKMSKIPIKIQIPNERIASSEKLYLSRSNVKQNQETTMEAKYKCGATSVKTKKRVAQRLATCPPRAAADERESDVVGGEPDRPLGHTRAATVAPLAGATHTDGEGRPRRNTTHERHHK